MNIKSLVASAALAAVLATASAANAAYTFVGNWNVGDGPAWGGNPLAYSGDGAAALLFGGSASDYVVSTVDNQVSNINNMAHYSVIGIGFRDFADNYFRGTEGTTHYQDVYVLNEATDTVSAYVNDFGPGGTNYAFRKDGGGVPEPASWALMISGFGLAGAALRRRRTVVAA